MYDYYQMILIDLENNEYIDKDSYDLNKFTIIDKLHGDSNIMLPIYINKNHWLLCKNLWSYHISFINNSFEYDYIKKNG